MPATEHVMQYGTELSQLTSIFLIYTNIWQWLLCKYFSSRLSVLVCFKVTADTETLVQLLLSQLDSLE